MMKPFRIRPVEKADHDAIRAIFMEIVRAGETYVFPMDLPESEFPRHWLGPGMHTYVAEERGRVVGTYMMKPNQLGLGNHVANGSFMVPEAERGRGRGRAMGEHALKEAKRLGYRAMQFNMVVATNTPAIRLWESLGFHIAGTLPGAFRLKDRHLTDAHIMYRKL